MANATPTLRPATWEDADFLYRLHRAALKQHVEQTWGEWEEEWQQRHFRQRFHPAACQVIIFEEQDVGVVCMVEQEAQVVVNVIEVLPECQGRGIGTFVMRLVLREAHLRGKPVALQVLKVNPARRLYERLGFITMAETETHYQMRALPPDAASRIPRQLLD
jgi:ribosomal protein S18 acetylase RimI-like enzyme